MSLSTLNAKLKKLGYPVELVKGEGYFYFVWWDIEDPDHRDSSEMIMVCHYCHQTDADWLIDAMEFIDRTKLKFGIGETDV